jgi:hypothetical protein
LAFAGSNQLQFANLQKATVDVGGSTVHLKPNGQRVYLNDGIFPNSVFAWPSLSDPSARACVSIRPPLWELINPDAYPGLATELDHFLKAAPKGPTSLVGLWHEASTAGPAGSYNKDSTPKGYFDYLDKHFKKEGGAAGLLRKAQTFVQKRARDLHANVKVGVIEVVNTPDAPTLEKHLGNWMADNLDFYACDVYDSRDGNAVPADLLGAFQTVVKGHMTAGHYPSIGITETNTRFPGRRPFWFTAAWSWLKSNGHTSDTVCFLTYWSQTGIESGAWIPDDWATIDALHGILAESSP